MPTVFPGAVDAAGIDGVMRVRYERPAVAVLSIEHPFKRSRQVDRRVVDMQNPAMARRYRAFRAMDRKHLHDQHVPSASTTDKNGAAFDGLIQVPFGKSTMLI